MHFVYVHDAKIAKENGFTLQFCSNYPPKMSRIRAMYTFLTNYEIRYAAHPEDAKSYDTTRIRRDFLIEKIFVPNEVNMVYSMYDRMVVGGALPVGEVLTVS